MIYEGDKNISRLACENKDFWLKVTNLIKTLFMNAIISGFLLLLFIVIMKFSIKINFRLQKVQIYIPGRVYLSRLCLMSLIFNSSHIFSKDFIFWGILCSLISFLRCYSIHYAAQMHKLCLFNTWFRNIFVLLSNFSSIWLKSFE